MGGVGDDVALSEAAQGHVHEHEQRRDRRADVGIAVVVLVIVAAAALRPLLQDLLDKPAVAHWATIFVAITVQAMPFLALGITVSAAIAAFVPDDFLPRVLPDRPALAVPVAAVAGAALPGCECGSVPIAGRLVSRGALPAAALTFLLSAPAINPVVLSRPRLRSPASPRWSAPVHWPVCSLQPSSGSSGPASATTGSSSAPGGDTVTTARRSP
jgi:uncharacterized protein